MWTKASLEGLSQLKDQAPFRGFVRKTTDGRVYRIRVVGRGEMAFYQLGVRATYVEIVAGAGAISAKSIRRWDDNKKISAADKALIIQHLSEFMRSLGAKTVTVA